MFERVNELRKLNQCFYGYVKWLERDNILVETSTVEAKTVSTASQNGVNHLSEAFGSS